MQRGNEAPFLPHAVPATQKHQSKCGEKPKKELCKTANRVGTPFPSVVVKFNLSRQQLHDFILCGGSVFSVGAHWQIRKQGEASLNHKRHFLKWSVTRLRWLLNYFEGMSRVSAIIAVKLWDVRMPNAICTNRYLLWHRLVGVVTILCEDLFLSVKRNVRSRCRLLASSFIERSHEHWCKM